MMGIPTELSVVKMSTTAAAGTTSTQGVSNGIYGGRGGDGGYPHFAQDDMAAYQAAQQMQQQQQQQQHFPPQAQQAPPQALPQQQQMGGFPPPPQLAMNTPWKLGSTDGTYAMNVAIRKQQQDGMHHVMERASSSSPVNANNDARLSPLLEDGMGPHNLQGPPGSLNPSTPSSGGGVIIGGTPSAASNAMKATVNNNINNNNSSNKKNTGGAGTASGAAGGGAASDTPVGFTNPEAAALIYAVQAQQSVYQDMLFRQPCGAVEAVLAAACEAMHFDIAEMWLRTGPKTHQLTNSHLRPTALEDSVRRDLVDVYYGEKSSERTHRLSPALCKRAKEANDVVWVTGHTPHGADALRASISNVRTAVAVPVCHEASNTNVTIIFFSIRRCVRK